MRSSPALPFILLATGLVLLVAGLYPKLAGGKFKAALFAPAATFLALGGAIRRRRRRDREREEVERGR